MASALKTQKYKNKLVNQNTKRWGNYKFFVLWIFKHYMECVCPSLFHLDLIFYLVKKASVFFLVKKARETMIAGGIGILFGVMADNVTHSEIKICISVCQNIRLMRFLIASITTWWLTRVIVFHVALIMVASWKATVLFSFERESIRRSF